MKKVKLRLNELLKERGYTQTRLKDESGVRQAAISDMCNNRLQRVQLDHLSRIAEALSINDMNEILTIVEDDGDKPED